MKKSDSIGSDHWWSRFQKRITWCMTKRERAFVETVWKYYKRHGRHDLPWRHTTDPYKILVSEIMLQQTQVERVLPKYNSFIKRWGSVDSLAQTPLAAVLTAWQGLGYNRRAKFLLQCAKTVTAEYDGQFPVTFAALTQLPGIGPYTAGAVMAFAYNQPVPIIETNIRTVYLYHFFRTQSATEESAVLRYVERTLDHGDPRQWYWALMDYGSHLKAQYGNLNRQAKAYQKQSAFQGSDRQIRGAIVRTLAAGKFTKAKLEETLSVYESDRVISQLKVLQQEGMVERSGQYYILPT